MHRRQFLALGAVGCALGAGCVTDSDSSTGSRTSSAPTRTETATPRTQTTASTTGQPESGTEDGATTESQTLVVSPTGSDQNSGAADAPLGSIQEALDRAEPGTTISLRPGVHTRSRPGRPVGITRRAGTPDAPIRITGPSDAVVRGPPIEHASKPLFHIVHSNIHLDGITLDGLTKPSEAGNSRWYRPQLVNCSPPSWQDSYPDYLTNVKIKPSAIGNSRKKLVSSYRTNNLEIGEFAVVGPAGVGWSAGDETGYPLGSIVSIGRSSNNFGTSHYPWDGPDESHDIHIHHIAHLDAHHHTELVVLHSGNHDVTIEYCTDTGGMTRSGVRFPAAKSTIRWCILTGSPESGVSVYVPPMKERGSYEAYSTIPDERFPGRNNDIYGNRLVDNDEGAIGFSSPTYVDAGPEDQGIICGNTTNGEFDGSCPESVPSTDEIGHTGGDSPWDG